MKIESTSDVSLVPARREDGPAIAAVVKEVFDEYGFTWEADGYCADLYDPVARYVTPGGMFWTLWDCGRVIGCVGVSIHGEEAELHRMYLSRGQRGRGLGRMMLQQALDYARERGCRSMRAWSDVKLTDAHRLYRASGFIQFGNRICDDPDNSPEFGFRKDPL